MNPIQQIFSKEQPVWEPLYRMRVLPEPVECELFQSAPLRRLKHLHHYGAGALVSPVQHSRLDHTIGVWALVKHFFPQWMELHIAAILHDVGHLPYSHSIERMLGFDHHLNTENAILTDPIVSILRKHGLSADSIVALLNQDSPLTHRSDFVGMDHLDSFLRDSQAAGINTLPPHELIRRIHFRGHYVETDEETAFHLITAIADDNKIFLSPYFLAVDTLLGQAAALHLESNPEMRASIAFMTDSQLTEQLKNSPSQEARAIIHVLLWVPHRIVPCGPDTPGGVRADVHKVYVKQPLVQGIPIRNLSPDASALLDELERLQGSYYFHINECSTC